MHPCQLDEFYYLTGDVVINQQWCIEVDESETEKVDQFLSAVGYNVFGIGASVAQKFTYFHNSNTGVTLRYGRLNTYKIAQVGYIIYDSLEELIDAHFTGDNNEEV